MGAITLILAQGIGLASTLVGTVNTVNRFADTITGGAARDMRREQDAALRQLQQRQNAQAQQLANQTALERERIAALADQDEEKRLASLRRAVARQRASAGASGVTSGDGSSQAILLGLFDQTEDELKERERLDNLRNASLDLDLSNQASINVLQRTQLQERQRLERQIGDDRFLF